jgi:hypothetical protein
MLKLVPTFKFWGKKEYKLTSPMVYRFKDKDRTIKKGFVTDLASRPLLNNNDRTRYPAVAHDDLYKEAGYFDAEDIEYTRKEADVYFLEFMAKRGVNFFKRWMFYEGVRLLGWRPWNRHYRQKYGNS